MNRRNRVRCWALLAAALLPAVAGCGPGLGAWLYTLGMVPKQQVPAEYKFSSERVLILVDDDLGLIHPPLARLALIDELAKQLTAQGITDHVTTNEELTRIRQSEPNFEQRGACEVGQLANADIVIWLATKQYSVNDDLELAASPGKFAVRLKVINARAQKREEVRLWPPEREGRLVEATISPHDIRACKTKAEVHRKMAGAMADEIARLFYDRQIQQ